MSDLKEKLLSLKAELSTRIEKINTDLTHRQTSHKFSEQSVEQQNDGVLYNLKSEAEEELEQIEHALKKFERNLYGKCETCHDDISNERLVALPFTAYCKNCAI
jgi:RNA polymerase-binding transcription factor DksA